MTLTVGPRKSGLEPIGAVSWGTHMCLFFETQQDLLDVLVSYFAAGLAADERCVWVTCPPVTSSVASEAMRRIVPDFDELLAQDRMRFIDYDEFYLRDGAFDGDRVLSSWGSLVAEALDDGFEGLRASGNTSWLEERDWDAFGKYERTIDPAISDLRILVLCTYPVGNCGASEIIEVIECHESSLVKFAGEWKLLESTDVTQARRALAEETRFTSALLDAVTSVVFTVDSEGHVLWCNEQCEALTGRPKSAIEGHRIHEVLHIRESRTREAIDQCWLNNGKYSFESAVPKPHEGLVHMAWSTAGIHDDEGNLEYVVITGEDITRHRDAQRRLEAAYKIEHRIARTLQESFLHPAPELPGVRLGVVYRPAVEAERVGGDFYDVFPLSGGRVALMVGDVSGKGIGAAGLTETVRSTMRTLLSMDLEPSEALNRACGIMLEQTRSEDFIALGVMVLELSTGQVEYASAGQPLALLLGSRPRFLDAPPGMPLGTFVDDYQSVRFTLGHNQSVILYTDGLSEARNGSEFFGDSKLLAVAGRQNGDPQAIVDGLLDAAEQFAGTLADDVAIVALSLGK